MIHLNELIKENFNVKETYDKKDGNTNRKCIFDIDTASSSVHFQMCWITEHTCKYREENLNNRTMKTKGA